jgi:superfamily I DNA/RNA helicase
MQMSETEELEQAVDRILRSTSSKKLIVAGPGAGKTFLFKRVLERTPGESKSRLVLTFINELKDDLERSLSDLASVYTLHGYCHYLLRRNPVLSVGLTDDFDYFPSIPTLIKRDWEIANGKQAPQFVGLMRDLQTGAETDFYLARSNYYDAIGYDDSVFRVHARLSEDPDQISQYDLVLIDEFQDFNRLESSFINLLASESPILIVGDDDQAGQERLIRSGDYFAKATASDGSRRL